MKDEYINKHAAIIEMMDNDIDHIQAPNGKEAVQILSDIPAADVAPVVHAHWIRHDDADIVEGHYVPSFECSQSQLRTEDNILGGLTHEQNRH